MSTNNPHNIPRNGYAVVWYGDYDGASPDPQVCNGAVSGNSVKIDDGRTYAIYETFDEALTEFGRWPTGRAEYGIIPVRLLLEERTVVVETTALSLKESARAC